jgi:signal peptidase I
VRWLHVASGESLRAAITAVVFALFARTFVVQAFQIPTGSMEPNLLIGDHVVVDKLIYAGDAAWWLPQRAVRRGDVVVFRAPDDPQRAYVKRCLGLAGDRIEIVNKRLVVNGEPRDEGGYVFHSDPRTYPAAATLPDAWRLRDNFGPVTVPPDGLFCLGDNRDNSKDSRFWGTVPRSAVRGRAVLVYWSAEPLVEGGWWKSVRSLWRRTRWSRCFQAVR